jgi:lipopolysaccharide heptosyltransferase III
VTVRRRVSRRFYRWLFRAYRVLFPTPGWTGSIPPTSLRRVLVMQRYGVGDMILTTPLLALIKHHAPDAEIDVLASRRNADVLAGDPGVARVFVDGRTRLGRMNVIRRLRARRYDAVFTGQAGKHMREAVTASLVAHRHTYKVSIWRPKRYQGLFTTIARVPPSLTHTAERLLFVGQHAFGVEDHVSGAVTGRYAPRMGADEHADAQARAFVSTHGIDRYVLVNVAAHFEVRDWPPDRCAAFIALLLARHADLAVIVTRPPGKDAHAAEAVRQSGSPRVVLAPALSLLGVAALVRRSVAVVTPDTALVHLASACRRPVVALYAPVVPSDVTLWLPVGVPYRTLASRLGGAAGEIAPERVLDAFDELLHESARSRVAAR